MSQDYISCLAKDGDLMKFKTMINVIDYILDDDKYRHLVGGALLSVSFLFGGLAITTMTVKEDKKDEQKSQVKPEDIREDTDRPAYAQSAGNKEQVRTVWEDESSQSGKDWRLV